MGTTLSAAHLAVDGRSASDAVLELKRAVEAHGRVPAALLVFCSPAFDLEQLGAGLASTFSCPIAGCTTAGQLGPQGFQPAGLTAVAIFGDDFVMRTYLLEHLDDVPRRVTELAARASRDAVGRAAGKSLVGLLLADGLSMAEERLAASLHQALDGIPIVGGSAGDDLAFVRTAVYFDGRFRSGAATVALIETAVPFTPFKFQHFAPTDTKVVITSAEPDHRVVREINGEPAAAAYAEALGAARLTPELASRHPLMLKAGDDYYVRSVQKVNDDGSLSFYCAIEEGLVLTIGDATDPLESARRAFASVTKRVGAPSLIVGCDCVLRRLEAEQRQLKTELGTLFARHHVVGFSTYGEQFNGLHVNQTFTGVAFGE